MPAQPPSREPGQAEVPDAEAEEWGRLFPDGGVARLLRDRTRYQERIRELETTLRAISAWAGEARALLEVQDG